MEEQSIGRGGRAVNHSEFTINFPLDINISCNQFSFRPVRHRFESVGRYATEQTKRSQENYLNGQQQIQPLDLSGASKSDKRRKSSEICVENPVNQEMIERTCVSLPAPESLPNKPKLSDPWDTPYGEKNPTKRLKMQPDAVRNKLVTSGSLSPLFVKSNPVAKQQVIPSSVSEGNLGEKPDKSCLHAKLSGHSPFAKNSPFTVSAIDPSSTEPIAMNQFIPAPVTESHSTQTFSAQSRCSSSKLKLISPVVESGSATKPSELKILEKFIPSPIVKSDFSTTHPIEPELSIPLPDEKLLMQPKWKKSIFPVVDVNPAGQSLAKDPPDVTRSSPISGDNQVKGSPSKTKSFEPSSFVEGSSVGKLSTELEDSASAMKPCNQTDLSPVIENSSVGKLSMKLRDSKLDVSEVLSGNSSSDPVPRDRFTPSPASESNTIIDTTMQCEGESNESGQSQESYSVQNFVTQFQDVQKKNPASESSAVQREGEPDQSGQSEDGYMVKNFLTQFQDDLESEQESASSMAQCKSEKNGSGQSDVSYSVENFLTQFQDDPVQKEPKKRGVDRRQRYPCDCCGRPFSSKRSLRKHMLSHTDQGFVCATCGRNFPTRTALFSHHRVHASQEKPHVCDVCGEGFAQRTLLTEHAQAHAKERPHVCAVCGKGFSRQGGLARHQLSHTGVEPYSCSLCGKGCRDGGALKAHIRTHTGERPHTCEVCDKSFSEKVNLRRHMLTHAKEMRFVCILCEERFYTKVALKAHRAAHRDEKPLVCDLCDARFAHRSGLRIHRATHSGDYRYSCVMCRRGFLYLSGLKVHFRTHSGEGRHQCGFCGKAFADDAALAEHMAEHAGDERPFRCDKCEARFADRGAFRRHANTHVQVKPFACDVCRKQFTYREALERHSRSHEGPFSCNICNKEYLYKRSLECHMQECHKEEAETMLVEAEPPPMSPRTTFILP